jgi:hypothetical protein
MVHQNWKDAYTVLCARSDSVDGEQLALARSLTLQLSSRLPATVAPVMIRERLAGPLRAAPPAEPTHGQLEYLTDLLDWLEIRRPRPTNTQHQVSAWIEVLEIRRAAKVLRNLQPAPGDIVTPINAPDDLGKVVSISDQDGCINIAAPGGKGLRPHEIQIKARATESRRKASEARRQAANRAAQLDRGTEPTKRLREKAVRYAREVGERMHKARHTAGQRVLDATGNLKAVQKLLGHASIQTTGDIYADWDIDQLAATMADVLSEDEEAPDAKIPGSRQKIPANEPKVETAGIEPASVIACGWLLRA